MQKIRNYNALTSHGDVESRKIVLDITRSPTKDWTPLRESKALCTWMVPFSI